MMTYGSYTGLGRRYCCPDTKVIPGHGLEVVVREDLLRDRLPRTMQNGSMIPIGARMNSFQLFATSSVAQDAWPMANMHDYN